MPSRKRRREAVTSADEARRDEQERVREQVGRDVAPASQGPVGPADVVGGPLPTERAPAGHADSDAAGVPGVPSERVEKGGSDRLD